MPATAHTATAALWCVSVSGQEAQIRRNYADLGLPTSDLFAKPEVGT
jgi:hypothetical protein